MNTHHTEIDEHDPTNAYQSLADTVGHDDPRWAFGSGVEDVQAEITSHGFPPTQRKRCGRRLSK